MFISHCSTKPAGLVVVSKVQGSVLSVTENVVPVADISADGVTLVPDHVLTSAPKTCFWVTSVIVCVVVVVLFIDPVVNWGVTVFALATAGDNRAKSKIHFFILLVRLVFSSLDKKLAYYRYSYL